MHKYAKPSPPLTPPPSKQSSNQTPQTPTQVHTNKAFTHAINLIQKLESVPSAIQTLRQLAQDFGHLEASYSLGVIYECGLPAPGFVQIDIQEAMGWFEIAAGGSHCGAQYRLGNVNMSTLADTEEARRLFHQASDGGNHPGAMFALGVMYEKGDCEGGVDENRR